MSLSETLRERGYVYQFSAPTLEEITDGPKRTMYLGVDPTADSIHAGNFAVYMLLRRCIDDGHKVILLIGGGTGMIGDPKPDVERPLTPPDVVAERSAKLATQARRILGSDVEVVNNHDWLATLDLIGFLRDIGKHFTVNSLIKKDAIAKRLESEEGITYTEFAYPLLQAYDFWHLYTTRGCDLQVSGSDQWGNITAGIDLIRRKENAVAHALTIPLITDKATGKKFGKSEGNAVWLDAEKTSPYQFYQFWFNASDESVGEYLKIFTLLSLEEIAHIMQAHNEQRGSRLAQKKLAHEVTVFVHGTEITTAVEEASHALFDESVVLTEEVVAILKKDAPSCAVHTGLTIMDVLVSAGLASSKREAREFLGAGAITVSGIVVDETKVFTESDFVHGVAVVRRGKKHVSVLIHTP